MKKLHKPFSRLSILILIKKKINQAMKVFSSDQQKIMISFNKEANVVIKTSFIVA